MKKLIKDNLIRNWSFLSVYSAFYKRHKSIYKNSSFEKVSLTNDEKEEYLRYWKRISPVISLKTVEITKTLSGVFNKYIIPEEVFALYIEKRLNSDKTVSFLENKSIYNKWFGRGIFPNDLFHKVNNIYYTYDFKIINDIEEFIDNEIDKNDMSLVAKPSKSAYGGEGVSFIDNIKDLKKMIKEYPNIVVQERIRQSKLINEFNKDSVNTIRVNLYKNSNGDVEVINTSIRMGKDGSLDNVTAGGIVCNIKPNGILNEFAVDKYATKYFEHPNSGFIFKNKMFPFYDTLLETSKYIGEKVLGARLISLDMALDNNENWRCIEMGFFGNTIRFAQYAGEPFFGKYTDEIVGDLVEYKKYL